jgi:hypothetical protein
MGSNDVSSFLNAPDITYLLRAIRNNDRSKIFVLYGAGSNGKTTLVDAIRKEVPSKFIPASQLSRPGINIMPIFLEGKEQILLLQEFEPDQTLTHAAIQSLLNSNKIVISTTNVPIQEYLEDITDIEHIYVVDFPYQYVETPVRDNERKVVSGIKINLHEILTN